MPVHRRHGPALLHVVQSNRLEALAAALFDVHARDAGGDPLEPLTIVVPSQGHGQWLKRELAARQGIAANLDLPLPSAFAWRLLRLLEPALPEASPYDKDALTLRVHRLLGGPLDDERFAVIRGYLATDADGCRRYQLARRIADVYDQYLVYRRDWIVRFEREDPAVVAAAPPFDREPWQPLLWRALVADIEGGVAAAADGAGGAAPRHRAALHDAMLARLSAPAAAPLPARVHVFGLTSLPPDQLELFGAVALHVDVHLYVWNPCREYWADIVSESTRAAISVRTHRPGRIDPARYYESGNPLLSALGRLGRDFVDLVNELAGSLSGDDEACFVDGDTGSMLGYLQRDVLDLTTRGMAGADAALLAGDAGKVRVDAADASIRMHVCHGALREVEVLHDALLERFEADPALVPRDIVVMIPDLERYAPLVDAVFGSAPPERFLPYAIADRRRSLAEPLVAAFLAWLAAARGRFTRSALLDLLEVPAVRRRFGIDDEALPEIRRFLDRAGVHWGRDGAHWRSLGLPVSATHVEQPGTWRFGLDRLLLGYALGNGAEPFAGVAPVDGIDDGNAEALAALVAFASALDAAADDFAGSRTLAAWAGVVGGHFAAFFAPGDGEQAAVAAIGRALQRAAELARATRHEEPVGIGVFVEHLRDAIDVAAQSPGFLGGGITFCTLLPMRTLPFRVVCLCGMNELDFPRRLPALDFDLMRHAPARKGDRAPAASDRHLFLEALLAARDALHVSWVGRSDVDDSPRPPSVLVAELRDYLDRVFVGAGGPVLEQLTVVHRLQPFSRAYFAGDTRLFSYDGRWLPHARPDVADAVPTQVARAVAGRPAEVSVADLRAFMRDPSRVFFEEALGARIPRQVEGDDDDEPFEVDGLLRWRLKDAGVDAWLAHGDLAAFEARRRLEGELPLGMRGERELGAVAQAIRAFAAVAGDAWLEQVAPREVDMRIGDTLLAGHVPGVRADGGYLKVRVGRANARDIAEFWLYHVVLCAAGGSAASCLLDEERRRTLAPMAAADAQAWLAELVALRARHLQAPVPLFPKVAQELVLGRGRVQEMWAPRRFDGGRSAGERDEPYVLAVWHGPDVPPAGFDEMARRVYGPCRARLGDAGHGR
jgi:exodeoxyribonuclease V gamma subunit